MSDLSRLIHTDLLIRWWGGFMRHRNVRLTALALAFAIVACGGQAPVPAAPSVTPAPQLATNAEEFGAAWCEAMAGMSRGIGNPDTNAPSELRASFETAIEAGDGAGINHFAALIQAELEAARIAATVAAGWEDGREAAQALDRVLAAFQIKVEATRGAGAQGLGPANSIGQDAFERAGAIEAWEAMLGAGSALPDAALELISTCE